MSPYLRTVKTSPGATAVQIVHSSRRGSRDIEHLGSAHTALRWLKAAGRQKLAAGQGELDLGLQTGAPGGPLPGVSLRLSQSPAPAMSARLHAGEVDLCLASQPLDERGLRSARILSEEVLLGVPPGHRLARRSRVTVDALAGEPFVTTRPGYWQRALADRLFAAAGIQPAIVCEGDEPYAIRALISAGVGVGLLPAVARRTAEHPAVAWLHLDAPGCRRTLSLAWRADAYRSAAARAFSRFALAHTWPSDS